MHQGAVKQEQELFLEKHSPIDPGCLPPWEVDELPEPKPFTRANWIRLIGPGIVMAGATIGTGEWIMGARAAAQYHGAMLWVIVLSILGQVILNTEVMRYTLCTGEPIMTGFMRCKPGPKFWLLSYLLLDFGAWWPSLAGLAAQIMVVLIQGLGPADTIDPNMVRNVSYIIFLSCAVLVLFGGKIYNTLEYVLGGKFLFVLFYLVICDLFFVSMTTWGEIWSGLIDFRRMPEGKVDFALISALAGFSGIGGLGNMMASNYVREKGWGMGSKVGAIASAFGGHHITLSHLGTMCRTGSDTVRRFRGWIKYLLIDQYCLWAMGSLIGMMLPAMLGAQYLKTTELPPNDHWRWAAALAQDFGTAQRSHLLRNLTLICGLVIMIPGQFSVIDGVARRWTDALWSGSQRLRRMQTGKVKLIYYLFAGTYVTWGICAYTFFPGLSASTMMIIAGNMANLGIAATIFHTLYVNRRFLPRELQPGPAKQVALLFAGMFFSAMFGLVVYYKVIPVVKDNAASAGIAAATLLGVLTAVGWISHCSVERERSQRVAIEPAA